MRGLKSLFAIPFACALAGAAQAGYFTTVTQYFDAHYAEHGSNYGAVDQYDGPLRIYSVTVDWDTEVRAWFDWPHDPDNDAPLYQQYYEGGAYWIAYDSHTGDSFAADGVSISGYTDCTRYSCAVSVLGEGTTNLDPYYFKGNDQVIFDANGGITPSWGFNHGEPFYSWEGLFASGTVTYALGPVPEPASWGMMVCGFGLIGCVARSSIRRRAVRYAS